MIEAVSDVIAARSREPEGLSKMVAVSIGVHVAALLLIALAPKPDYSDDAPRTVMTVSLGGAPGPRSGGMTPMGGRAVQAPAPPEPARPRAEAPPAPKAPEMALPTKDARQRPPARPAQAPRESTGRTPSVGEEPREGSARAETGARGQGFGLTTGGGGGTGAYLDVGNFCCPEWLETVVQRIQQNWNMRQGITGQVMVKFTIQRDGSITDAQVERSSGFAALDMNAHRAVLATRQVPALPAQFPNSTLTVHLRFDYQR
jgi:periplasmic protein TonB